MGVGWGWTIGPRGIKQTFHCILLFILDPSKYITCSKTILRKTNLPQIELNTILIPGLSTELLSQRSLFK